MFPVALEAKARGTALVTGGTGGIGASVAVGLAKAGYRTVIVGRDRAKGEAVLARIRLEAPAAETALILADLSSLTETRALGARVASEFPDLTLLVNNAGAFTATREATSEGRERVLAVNHLAPFVLTRALEETLKANAPARIVSVGSTASDHARVDPDDLELARGWGRIRAYAQSKLALMMAAFDDARRLAGTGVTVNVVHPGAVATDLVRTPGIIGLAWSGLRFLFRSPDKGAETPLHACLAPELAGVSGRYFKDKREAKPNRRALDPALRARVVAATERLVGSA